jgi:hypothetical protein
MKEINELPRIKTNPLSREYREVQLDVAAHSENQDCMVRALTLLTSKPYKEVNDALIAAGRKPRKGTAWIVACSAMNAMGFKLEQLTNAEYKAIIARYPGVHKNLNSITTHHPRRFAKVWADMEPLLFDLDEHVAAFKNGELHDWSSNKALRVKALYRLLPLEPVVDAPLFKVELPTGEPPYNDAHAMGRYDYQRGHTACPFGDESRSVLWRKGFQEMKDANNGKDPD